MKNNILKCLTFFIWSPVIAPIYYIVLMHISKLIHTSNIDGSIILGNIVITSMQLSSLMFISALLIDVVLQIILAIIYNKNNIFTGKFKMVKITVSAIISYIIFIITLIITLRISFTYTMSRFH